MERSIKERKRTERSEQKRTRCPTLTEYHVFCKIWITLFFCEATVFNHTQVTQNRKCFSRCL